jgi:hypothetical protein
MSCVCVCVYHLNFSTTANHAAGSVQRSVGNNQVNTARKRHNSDNDDDSKQRKCGLCKQAG